MPSSPLLHILLFSSPFLFPFTRVLSLNFFSSSSCKTFNIYSSCIRFLILSRFFITLCSYLSSVCALLFSFLIFSFFRFSHFIPSSHRTIFLLFHVLPSRLLLLPLPPASFPPHYHFFPHIPFLHLHTIPPSFPSAPSHRRRPCHPATSILPSPPPPSLPGHSWARPPHGPPTGRRQVVPLTQETVGAVLSWSPARPAPPRRDSSRLSPSPPALLSFFSLLGVKPLNLSSPRRLMHAFFCLVFLYI